MEIPQKELIPRGLQRLRTVAPHAIKGYEGGVIWSRADEQLLIFGDSGVRIYDSYRNVELWHNDAFAADVFWDGGREPSAVLKNGMLRVGSRSAAKIDATNLTQAYVLCLFSPDGQNLALVSREGIVTIVRVASGARLCNFDSLIDLPPKICWSKDGSYILAIRDSQALVFDAHSGARCAEHCSRQVPTFAIAACSQKIATASYGDIHISRLGERTSRLVLEGHTGPIEALSFSPNETILASRAVDGTIRLWNTASGHPIAILPNLGRAGSINATAFHPTLPLLAFCNCKNHGIEIWQYDEALLVGGGLPPNSVQYTNAKVVLLGDSGVGKSGLALVLSGQNFAATDSTHARQVWQMNKEEISAPANRLTVRETVLWDMAGQPGYRLIHQLHLNEVAVALIVFDAKSETDTLSGIRHWDRALRQAERTNSNASLKIARILVAARTDRGRLHVNQERLQKLKEEVKCTRYIETSAKEDEGIAELRLAIDQNIDWDKLPVVISTVLFQGIKTFLLEEKRSRILTTGIDLYRSFILSENCEDSDELRRQFETCIQLLASRDLLKRLSFGNYILLRPELLDTYASALTEAAKDEPGGFGSVVEEDAKMGRFRMPQSERIQDDATEKMLLIATVEDLLRHEIALREPALEGPYLVFPSQLTRENPRASDGMGRDLVFIFDGPVLNVYATLVVRLAHSGLFQKRELWRNVASFTTPLGGLCSIVLREVEEGTGELTLEYEPNTPSQAKGMFESCVASHLLRKALPETVRQRRTLVCVECTTPVSDLAVERRLRRGQPSIQCPVCDFVMPISQAHSFVPTKMNEVWQMERAADEARDEAAAALSLHGKLATLDFDVFLAHKSTDKVEVIRIANKLRSRGMNPWLDVEQIRPGQFFQDAIQAVIKEVKAVLILIGKDGLGRWQVLELRTFISQCIDRGIPVIPVLLEGVSEIPAAFPFLRELNAVHILDLDAFDKLEWGITGRWPSVDRFSDVEASDANGQNELADDTVKAGLERAFPKATFKVVMSDGQLSVTVGQASKGTWLEVSNYLAIYSRKTGIPFHLDQDKGWKISPG